MSCQKINTTSNTFEQLLIKIIAIFNDITSPEVSWKLKQSLHLIAEFVGVDRTYVVQFNENPVTKKPSYFWVINNDHLISEKLKTYPEKEFPWLFSEIRNKRPVIVHSLDQVPDSAIAEKRYCQDVGIKSFFMMPIIMGDSVVGALGMDTASQKVDWTDDLIRQSKIITEILACHYARWQEEIRFSKALEFEYVITEIASDFARVDKGLIDNIIEESMGRICVAIHADFATVLQFNDKEDKYYVTHQWLSSDLTPDFDMLGTVVDDDFPWLAKTLKKNSHLAINSLNDFPKEAYKEKQFCKQHGLQSVLWVSFPKAGGVNGFIAINTIFKEQSWSDEYIQRLKLIGAIFAHSLENKKNQEQLHVAQTETILNRVQLFRMNRIQTLNEMTAGIAHEINQPLAAIDNYAQACYRRIVSGTGSPEKLRDLVEKIGQQSRRAGEVISRLRDMIKKEPVELVRTDINAVVKDAVSLANLEKHSLNFNIDVKLVPSLPYATANAIQIQQVLLNIIRNAQNAIESVEQPDKRVIFVETKHNQHSTIEISVADQGKGISEEIRDELFEPFVTNKKSGLGVGLSICRSIIDYHGGNIWYTKRPRGGTIFHVTLPIHNERN